MDLLISGISASAIILAIIEAAKALGMNIAYARWVNGGLSVLAYLVIIFIQVGYLDIQVVTWVVTALGIFLGAAGFYDIGWPILDKVSGRIR